MVWNTILEAMGNHLVEIVFMALILLGWITIKRYDMSE